MAVDSISTERVPRIITRRPESSLQEEYRRCLELGAVIYNLKDSSFFSDRLDEVVTWSINLLEAYSMDPSFLRDNPENVLLTLAVAQEFLQTRDPQERERLHLIFAFGADNPYSDEHFNYSEEVMDRYTNNYVPSKKDRSSSPRLLPEEVGVRRINLPDAIAEDFSHIFTSGRESAVIDLSIKRVLLSVCHRLDMSPSALANIDIVFLPEPSNTLSSIGTLGMTEALGNGRIRITLSSDADPHVLEHEALHALLGNQLVRGYNGILFSGANEAWTERLTESPREYSMQRIILDEIFDRYPKLVQSFGAAVAGDKEARMDFFIELIGHYGIAAYLQFALFSPGAAQHIIHEVGKINRIFYEPQHVREFFAHPYQD